MIEIPGLQGALIVSCQPVVGGPLDRDDLVVAMARAARDGGAKALRIESVDRVQRVTSAQRLPVIGIVKRDLPDSPVRITPLIEDAVALCQAGASVVAVDATARERPCPVRSLLAAIHAQGRMAMADCATLEEGLAAWDMGFDWVGTTLSGYTEATACAEDSAPDWGLLRALHSRSVTVIAEGRIRTPADASRALQEGAYAVTVGSAITRVEHITGWFASAMDAVAGCHDN